VINWAKSSPITAQTLLSYI